MALVLLLRSTNNNNIEQADNIAEQDKLELWVVLVVLVPLSVLVLGQ